jgi:hypothetical protein
MKKSEGQKTGGRFSIMGAPVCPDAHALEYPAANEISSDKIAFSGPAQQRVTQTVETVEKVSFQK